jgi:hypothetical protein
MRRLALLLSGGLLIAAHAQAQTMYRCGSVYQDRPCDAGRKGRVVGSTGGAQAAPPTTGVDPECVRRARDSNKIVWAREGGATEERLLSEATSERQRRLIRDVYRRPGAASTVQAAVQADCVAEKQREDEEAALAIAAALKARKDGTAAPAPVTTVQRSAADAGSPDLAAQQRAAYEAEQRKRQCARYNDDMERVRREERTGGSAAVMDRLNERRRELREQMSRAGC